MKRVDVDEFDTGWQDQPSYLRGSKAVAFQSLQTLVESDREYLLSSKRLISYGDDRVLERVCPAIVPVKYLFMFLLSCVPPIKTV